MSTRASCAMSRRIPPQSGVSEGAPNSPPESFRCCFRPDAPHLPSSRFRSACWQPLAARQPPRKPLRLRPPRRPRPLQRGARSGEDRRDDRRPADHRGRTGARAGRARPAICAAAARTAPGRGLLGDHRNPPACGEGARRRASTRTPTSSAAWRSCSSARCTAN